MDNQADTSASENNSNDASLLLKIEEMVKTHLTQIDTLAEDISKHKDMLDDILANNQTYQEHDKIAKEAAKIRSKTKSEIMKGTQAADLSSKLKTLKSEKKELEEGVSDYLREYQRLSGLNEIEDASGEMREIILVPKLVKKSTFRP